MSTRHERKDAMENRQLILQTAHQLFDIHGVQSVSMHQIAKTAGIGQATLYRKYAHKGDLCFDMLDHYAKQFIEQIAQFLDQHQGDDPLRRLSGLMDFWIDAIEEKADLIAELASHMNLNCEDSRGNFFASPMYSFIRNKLSEYNHRGHRHLARAVSRAGSRGPYDHLLDCTSWLFPYQAGKGLYQSGYEGTLSAIMLVAFQKKSATRIMAAALQRKTSPCTFTWRGLFEFSSNTAADPAAQLFAPGSDRTRLPPEPSSLLPSEQSNHRSRT